MATLGSLIVEIGGEKRGLTQALLDAARETSKFTDDTGHTLTRASQRFAEITLGMAVKMEQTFAQTTSRLRENLFRGVINKEQFAQQGAEAAQTFNDSLTKMIDRLKRKKWLSEEDRQTLVSQYKDAGLKAGLALSEGIARGTSAAGAVAERTGGQFERLRSRIGPASVAVIFGIESMVRGAEAGESGIRTAFRGIATAATALGPEGIVVAALIGFGLAAYEHFTRARREAEKTAREFGKTAADIARSGDVMRAAMLQQTLFTGDQFAGIEGQREKESQAQFIARAEGIIGLRKRIADISERQVRIENNSALTPQQRNARLGAMSEELTLRNQLVDVLRVTEDQYKKIGQVADIVNKRAGEEAQNNLNRLREATEKKAATKAGRVDPVDVVGSFVSQIEASRRTIESLGQTTRGLGPAIGNAYRTVTDLLLKATDPLARATLRLEDIRNRLVRMMTGATPGISDIGHPDRFAGLTDTARTIAINDESIRKLQDAIAKTPPRAVTLPAQTQVGRLDVVQAELVTLFGTIGNTITGQLLAMFGPVALVMRIIQPALDIISPLLDALIRPMTMLLQVIAAGLEPAFRLLYPIIRASAIASTYLAQIFYNIAAAVTRFIGNLIIGFGNVVKAIATAIDKIPGINARGAIRAGEGIIHMGESMLDAADGFTKAANEMGNLRKKLNEMGWEEAKQGVDELGESARETADALRNVPTWIRVNLEAWLAANVTPPGGTPTAAPPGTIPPRATPVGTRPGPGAAPTRPPLPVGAPDGVQVSSISVANVTVLARSNPEDTWRDMLAAARRKAISVYGDASRWSELLEA